MAKLSHRSDCLKYADVIERIARLLTFQVNGHLPNARSVIKTPKVGSKNQM